MGLSTAGESQSQHSAPLPSPCGGGERAGTPATASASEAPATGYRCSPDSPSLGSLLRGALPGGDSARPQAGAHCGSGKGCQLTAALGRGCRTLRPTPGACGDGPRQQPAGLPGSPGAGGSGGRGQQVTRHPGTRVPSPPRGGLAPAGAGPGGAGGVRQRGRPRGSAGLKGRRRRRGEGDSAAGRAGSGRGCGDLLRSGRLHSLGPSSPVVGLSPAGPRAAAVPRWGLSPTALCSPQVQRWGASPLSRS